ncbi:HTH araC/xylS-type domain-containing protein [Bordetella muralis]
MSSDLTPPVFRWNTDDIPVHHRFDQYVEMVRKNLISVTTRCSDTRGFKTDMQVSPLGRLRVASIGGSAKQSARTRQNIKASGDRAFHLVAGLTNWDFECRDQRIKLNATDLVLIDTEREYASRLPDGFRNHTVSIAPDVLRKWLSDPDRIVGKRLRGDKGWGHVLSTFVDQLVHLDVTRMPLPASVLEDQLGALITLSATDGVGRSEMRKSTQADLRGRIIESIRQRCTDIGLTAAQIAADIGISPRTLHRALSAGSETFGALLLTARSDVAYRMLISPQFDTLTIADIGFRAGFADESHFSRTMRARYGHPPAQLRRTRS